MMQLLPFVDAKAMELYGAFERGVYREPRWHEGGGVIHVMAGLVPAIHVLRREKKDVDARHKAGHDGVRELASLHRRKTRRLQELVRERHHQRAVLLGLAAL